ncbi:hypothetical protein GCM10022233_75680 [Streptomyces shaanxiensis]|uniref:Type II toxin-antitoxin system RelE/ParE family toxin n=1 Tax=Streptomyces shaanxiensis TaxID=653357 RepID=A0ABP7W7P4_9ACTN
MSYTIIWERAASEGLKRLRARDGDAVKPLVKAINVLAHDPEPAASSKLGTTSLRRLRVGAYRATYEIDGGSIAIRSSWSAVRLPDRDGAGSLRRRRPRPEIKGSVVRDVNVRCVGRPHPRADLPVPTEGLPPPPPGRQASRIDHPSAP